LIKNSFLDYLLMRTEGIKRNVTKTWKKKNINAFENLSEKMNAARVNEQERINIEINTLNKRLKTKSFPIFL